MPDSIFNGIPGGGNPGGGQTAVPSVGATPTPAIGGQGNPLLPQMPSGSQAPSSTFPAYGSNIPSASTLGGMSPAPAGMAGDPKWGKSIKDAFHKAGFPNAIADLLSHFLSSGAGFNPQAIQALLASMQPGIAQGQANIMEQFGAEGLSSSSPAAIGLAGFDAQVSLNEGQIIAQMYEKSVTDYMDVLMAGRKPQGKGGGMGIGSLLGGAGQAAGGVGDLIGALGAGGGAAAAGGAAAGSIPWAEIAMSAAMI